MFETAATVRINALASRFASIDAAEIDRRPPAPAWEGQGGKRAQWYAEEMEALVDTLRRETAALRAEVARLGGQVAVPEPGSETMPSEGPGHDYWAVVALGGSEDPAGERQAFVIHRSPDCEAHEVFANGPDMSENGNDLVWTAGRSNGLYLVHLAITGDGDDFTLDVKTATTICALDRDTATTVAEEIRDLHARVWRANEERPQIGTLVHVKAGNGATSGRLGTIEAIRYGIRLHPNSDGTDGPLVDQPRESFTVTPWLGSRTEFENWTWRPVETRSGPEGPPHRNSEEAQ